jgi:hypothetical protein
MPNAHSVVKSQIVSRVLALVLGLTIGLLASPAFAARVVWKQTKVKEADKSWKVSCEIHLDRAPDIAHMPMRFTFTAQSYFERALVDGRKDPVIRQIPLEHQQPIIESVDVGFLDPGTGKTAKRTRFSFHVTRDRGFEAGTYEVKVTDARSGQDLGGGTTLTFDGENDVIDRRSMVFDEKKPKKSDDAPAKEAKAEEKELSPEDDAFWAGGKSTPEEKTAPLPPPAHLQDRPGCGCRVGASPSSLSSTLLAALAMCVLLRRRLPATRDAT